MDIKGLEQCKSNIKWLEENKEKISFKEFFEKIFEGTNATEEDMIHYAEVIKKTLVEAKEKSLI
jgi:lipoate-protein ligase A